MTWTVLGYGAFGFLLGFISGMTEGHIAQYLLGLLVAFLGGSINYFLNKQKHKAELGAVLFAFSVLCVCGISSGVYIRANNVLWNGQGPLAQTRHKADDGEAEEHDQHVNLVGAFLKSSDKTSSLGEIHAHLDNIMAKTPPEQHEIVREEVDRIAMIIEDLTMEQRK